MLDETVVERVRGSIQEWYPDSTESSPAVYRESAARYLEAVLDNGDTDEVQATVETYAASNRADVEVDGEIGLLVELGVGESTVERTKRRIRRMRERYTLLIVLGVEVRDESVFRGLREECEYQQSDSRSTEIEFYGISRIKQSGSGASETNIDRVIANFEWILLISIFNLFLFWSIFGGVVPFRSIPLPIIVILVFALGVAQFTVGVEEDE